MVCARNTNGYLGILARIDNGTKGNRMNIPLDLDRQFERRSATWRFGGAFALAGVQGGNIARISTRYNGGIFAGVPGWS